MTIPQKRELRGFDSYELRLGDELRGERACLGKSLFDVQRDLRIKACYIDAIENSDPATIENQSFVAGYIRSYARYLKLDADEVYRRFCEESGFVPARQRIAQQSAKTSTEQMTGAPDPFGSGTVASVLDRQPGVDYAPMISAAASVIAVAALIGGIGYGAWTFLTNIQQVTSAPQSQEAAAVISMTQITGRPEAIAIVDPSVYEDDGVLAQLYRNDDAAQLGFSPADGPIAAIDPHTAGVFARNNPPTAAVTLARSLTPQPLGASDGLMQEGVTASAQQAMMVPYAYAAAAKAQMTSPAVVKNSEVTIQAVEDAWVRVDAPSAGVLFSGLLSPGETFDVPDGQRDAILKVGNAGGVIILVNGAPFGPMGAKGVVQSGIALDPDVIRASYPSANGSLNSVDMRSAAILSDARG